MCPQAQQRCCSCRRFGSVWHWGQVEGNVRLGPGQMPVNSCNPEHFFLHLGQSACESPVPFCKQPRGRQGGDSLKSQNRSLAPESSFIILLSQPVSQEWAKSPNRIRVDLRPGNSVDIFNRRIARAMTAVLVVHVYSPSTREAGTEGNEFKGSL